MNFDRGYNLHPPRHHHGRICLYIGRRAAVVPFRQPGALGVCPLPLSGHDHGKLHQNPGRKSDAGAAGGGYRLGCGIDELLCCLHGKRWNGRHLPGVGRYHPGAGGHEHPGGYRMPGIVGAFGRKALCQADS